MQKLGHHCALNLWKGFSQEPGDDKEGFWIQLERLDCNRMAWKDSRLPSLWAKSQVDSGGMYYSAITYRHQVAKFGSL